MKIKKLAYGGLLIALGVILPQLFHSFGQEAGRTFLPMHIPVLLAGLLIGPYWGAGVAVILPFLSSMVTGMPAVPMLYFMVFELCAYAVVTGFIGDKLNIYLNLIITLICGRIVNGLVLTISVKLLGFTFNFATPAAFFGGIVMGLPGIAIQLFFIPIIMFALKKGGLTFGSKTNGSN